jgi:hypothetical protein
VLKKKSVYTQVLQWVMWAVVSFLIIVSAEAQSTFGTSRQTGS